MASRLAEIQEKLRRRSAGEGEQQNGQPRRRHLWVVGGGAGVAALVATPRAWAARHGHTIAASTVSAVGASAITAAVIGHPAGTPQTEPTPRLSPPTPVPTASADPAATPAQSPPRPHRTNLPAPLVAPLRRRGSGPSSVPPSSAPPGPVPSPSSIPIPAYSTPRPSPSPTCVLVLRVNPILRVCL
jgi:hypothetical protein